MEYTKGEWTAEHIGNEGKCVIHTGDLSLPFAHTFPNRFRNPQVSSEEAKANAQLIASAPALLEALKEANEYLYWGESGNESILKERVERAITKAEGVNK